MAIIITGTYTIRITWQLAGVDWALNVLHAQLPGGASVDQALADAWATDLAAVHTSSGLAAVQPSTIAIDRVGVRDVRVANQAEHEAPVGSLGTSALELLPRQVGIKVTTRTSLAGRSFRGGPTIPGFDEAQNNGAGQIMATASDAAEAFVEGIRTAALNRGHTLSVGSVKLGISTPITEVLVRDQVWDTQRRRGFNGI